MKWLIATVLALVFFSGLRPFLRRFGVGRMPGDFSVSWRGRQISIPLGSTLVLSVLMALIMKLL
jgi:Protein of unknown function (DUF2905)